MEMYYREKVIKLYDKLFMETEDRRSRIINCESEIFGAYLASKHANTLIEIEKQWNALWNQLNEADSLTVGKGRVISSFSLTVRKRRNNTMEKYLLFFQEEFYRVINA